MKGRILQLGSRSITINPDSTSIVLTQILPSTGNQAFISSNSIYSGSPGIFETKTTTVPLTKYYEFYAYAPAVKRYIYKWKLGESLPSNPRIYSVTLRKGGLKAQLLEDLDELREQILKTDGNMTYELNASNNVPMTFEWLDTASGYNGWANAQFFQISLRFPK